MAISFSLTDDQKMIKDTLHSFAEEQLKKIARECDEESKIPEGVINKAHELALLRNILPEEYGGFGEKRSCVTNSIIIEELAYGDLSLALHILAPALVSLPLLEMGTEEQKKKYLPLFCKDTFTPATLALVEPKFGFEPSSLSTTAVLDGSEYIINGEKCFVPLAKDAEIILVFAQTNRGTGYAGVDGFLIEKGTPGMIIKEKEKNLGLRALSTHEIKFTDCRIKKENKLGEEKRCDYLKILSYCRVGLAAAAVGVARAAYEYAKEYAKTRYAFGEPIASRQAIAFMLADAAIEIDATRLLVWEAAWRLDKDMECTKEAYLCKNYAADMALKVTDAAVQILGGHGYIRDHPVEMWLRNARGLAVFEGMVIV